MRGENKAAEVFDRKAGRKVMKKRDFAEIIEKLCPSETAESWDNCGFQVGDPEKRVERAFHCFSCS